MNFPATWQALKPGLAEAGQPLHFALNNKNNTEQARSLTFKTLCIMRTFLIFLFICLSAKAAVAQQSPGAISVGQSGGTVTVTTVASPYSTNFLNPSAKVRWCYFKPGYGWKSGIPGYMASVGGNLTFTRPTEAQGLVLFVRKEVSWQLVSGTKTHCTAWQ